MEELLSFLKTVRLAPKHTAGPFQSLSWRPCPGEPSALDPVRFSITSVQLLIRLQNRRPRGAGMLSQCTERKAWAVPHQPEGYSTARGIVHRGTTEQQRAASKIEG